MRQQLEILRLTFMFCVARMPIWLGGFASGGNIHANVHLGLGAFASGGNVDADVCLGVGFFWHQVEIHMPMYVCQFPCTFPTTCLFRMRVCDGLFIWGAFGDACPCWTTVKRSDGWPRPGLCLCTYVCLQIQSVEWLCIPLQGC